MLASDTDPKAKGKGGKSSGGKKYAQPIRSAADIAPLLARQQARQLSNATRG